MSYVVGIDIGGTNTRMAVVTRDGQVVDEEKISTSSFFDPVVYTNVIIEKINELKDRNGPDLLGIGIGSPCVNIQSESIENASNLNWKTPLYLCEVFRNEFQIPVKITNDANLFAIGEKVYGRNHDKKDFIVVTLGTGVGGGIVCGGELLNGRDGLAGEIGHLTVERGGRQCMCGRKGCLETYTSASGITRTVAELIADQYDLSSKLASVPASELTTKMVAEFAQMGDSIAIETFRRAGDVLGESLANLAVLFNPEVIYIAGGVANAGDLLMEPVKASFNENLIQIFPKEITIELSTIPENDGAVLGAGALIWDYLTTIDHSKFDSVKIKNLTLS